MASQAVETAPASTALPAPSAFSSVPHHATQPAKVGGSLTKMAVATIAPPLMAGVLRYALRHPLQAVAGGVIAAFLWARRHPSASAAR